MWMRDTDVAGESEVESAAHAVAVNSGANRSRELVHREHQLLTHQCEIESVGMQRGDFVEVGARGEELVIAGDDERLRIFCEFLDGSGEVSNACERKPIRAIIRPKLQDVHAVAFFDYVVFA